MASCDPCGRCVAIYRGAPQARAPIALQSEPEISLSALSRRQAAGEANRSSRNSGRKLCVECAGIQYMGTLEAPRGVAHCVW
eukprot:COSAG01_NODE_3574_length_5919_cov_7.990550_4_plen_82_part_00